MGEGIPVANVGDKQHRHRTVRSTKYICSQDEDRDGIITNDKYCMTRYGKLQLSWWRRPLRLRS
jgi:hypothetical protein